MEKKRKGRIVLLLLYLLYCPSFLFVSTSEKGKGSASTSTPSSPASSSSLNHLKRGLRPTRISFQRLSRQNLAQKWQDISSTFWQLKAKKVKSPATFWQSATKKWNFLQLFAWQFHTTFEEDFA